MDTVTCRCCKEPVEIEYQTRINLRTGQLRSALFLITCRNPKCGLGKDQWTFAFEKLEEYADKDLTLYLKAGA